ncbi:unnamed protein product [Ixodes pacificus]
MEVTEILFASMVAMFVSFRCACLCFACLFLKGQSSSIVDFAAENR